MYFSSEIWIITLMAALWKLACMINKIWLLKLTNYYEEICIYLWLLSNFSKHVLLDLHRMRKGMQPTGTPISWSSTPSIEDKKRTCPYFQKFLKCSTRFWAYQNIGEGNVAEMRSQRNDHAIGEGNVAKILSKHRSGASCPKKICTAPGRQDLAMHIS